MNMKSLSVPNFDDSLKEVGSKCHDKEVESREDLNRLLLKHRKGSLQLEDNLSLLDLYGRVESSVGELGSRDQMEDLSAVGGRSVRDIDVDEVSRDMYVTRPWQSDIVKPISVGYDNYNEKLDKGRIRGHTVGEFYSGMKAKVLNRGVIGAARLPGVRADARHQFMASAITFNSLNASDVSGSSVTTMVLASVESSKNAGVKSEDLHYDRYGFRKQSQFVREEEYNAWWNQYSKYCVRRKHKWKALLAKSGLGLDNDNPDRYPSKSEKLKRYVRKGIPAEWRGNAWWYFARGQEKLNKNKDFYDGLLAKMNGPNESLRLKDLDVIERDLNRTFPDNIYFQKSQDSDEEPPIIKSLRRVLVAFSIYNPKIGYCQSMNFLSGLLLLFMNEERAFWMLVIITSRYLPGVHNINLEGVNVDQGVLMLCIKEYLPEFWSRIYSKNNSRKLVNRNEFLYNLPPMTLCTASWFMSCFIGTVPIETTLRIWDCLFYEESNVLFKISLSIIRLSESEFPPRKRHFRNKDDEDMEIFQVIQTFPKCILDPNDIFDKVIFRKRIRFNSLNQEEIDRCRKYVTSQRQKFKNFTEIMGDNIRASRRDFSIHHDTINEALASEEYGFRRSLTGVHWNNNIKEKVRQLNKKT